MRFDCIFGRLLIDLLTDQLIDCSDRPDSVRCIVNLLTEQEQLEVAGEACPEDEALADSDAECDTADERWTKWRPDPVSGQSIEYQSIDNR